MSEDVGDILGTHSAQSDQIGSVLVSIFVVGRSEGKDSQFVFGMGIAGAQADIITVPFIFDSYEIESINKDCLRSAY